MLCTRDVVVLLDVELADRTGRASLQQPLIYTLLVEEVHAGHGSHFVSLFVFHEAHHALAIALVLVVLALLDLFRRHLAQRQAIHDRLGGGLADLIQVENLYATHVSPVSCLLLADMLQDLKKVDLVLRESTARASL